MAIQYVLNPFTNNFDAVDVQTTPPVSSASVPRFTLSGETVPFVCIDGCYRVKATASLASVDISMLNSGTSGSTVIQVNQYRAGALLDSETASFSSSTGDPKADNVALSGTLSLVADDLLTVDINSVASGSPSEISVEPIFT